MMAKKTSKIIWKLISKPPKLLYKLGLGAIPGQRVLLLTTIGRKSKKPRTTPLQYEKIKGVFYVGSARGQAADWFRNILANSKVEVQIKNQRFQGFAETVTDLGRIADFLEIKFQRHPTMMGVIMYGLGFLKKPSLNDFKVYAANKVVVIIHPVNPEMDD